MTDPILVTRERAAELLGCSPREIDRLRADGDIEAVKQGRRIKITYASLLAYVASLRAA